MLEAKKLNNPKRRSIIPDLNYTHYQKQTDIIKECHEKEALHKWLPKPTKIKQGLQNDVPESQWFQFDQQKTKFNLQPRNGLWKDDKGQLCEG